MKKMNELFFETKKEPISRGVETKTTNKQKIQSKNKETNTTIYNK